MGQASVDSISNDVLYHLIVMWRFNLVSNNEGYIEKIYLKSGLLVFSVVIFWLLSFGLMKIDFDEWLIAIYNNRGLGLHSYQQIINQCPNVWKQTICEDGQFTQILAIVHL